MIKGATFPIVPDNCPDSATRKLVASGWRSGADLVAPLPPGRWVLDLLRPTIDG